MNISVKPTDWRIKFQRFGIGIYILLYTHIKHVQKYSKELSFSCCKRPERRERETFYGRFIEITNSRRLYTLPKGEINLIASTNCTITERQRLSRSSDFLNKLRVCQADFFILFSIHRLINRRQKNETSLMVMRSLTFKLFIIQL